MARALAIKAARLVHFFATYFRQLVSQGGKIKRKLLKELYTNTICVYIPGKEAPVVRPKPRPSITTTMAAATPATMRSFLE